MAPAWQLAVHEYCELCQGDGLSNISNRSSFFMGLLRERNSGAPAGPGLGLGPGLGAELGRSQGSGRSWGWGRRVGRELGWRVGRRVG